MTTKHRLTNLQRSALTHHLNSLSEDIIRTRGYDGVAHHCSRVLGFEINANHVRYVLRAAEDLPLDTPEPTPTVQLELPSVNIDAGFDRVPDDAQKYHTSNATQLHGKNKPWYLTDREIAIETLERLRRLETRMTKIMEHLEIPFNTMHDNHGTAARPSFTVAAGQAHGPIEQDKEPVTRMPALFRRLTGG